jgi:hypothetical protein
MIKEVAFKKIKEGRSPKTRMMLRSAQLSDAAIRKAEYLTDRSLEFALGCPDPDMAIKEICWTLDIGKHVGHGNKVDRVR